MGLKKGTKLVKNPKEYVLRVRVDEKTVEALNLCCKSRGKSRSDFIREAINRRIRNERRTNQTSSNNEESC